MSDIEDAEQNYAADDESEAEVCYNNIPSTRLFSNYHKVKKLFEKYIKNCYERPLTLYYVVANPFKAKYEKNKEFYNTKGIDYVRKNLTVGSPSFLLTREIRAGMTHINALIWTKTNLLELHKTSKGKYGYWVTEVPTMKDRERLVEYLIKESKYRKFDQYRDYLIK